MNTQDPELWQGDYKIPWNDPDFSTRMLREHLAQDHDLASRRTEWIDKQVAFIHHSLLEDQTATILDLGCGPGLYTYRLARLGHHCRGIDFGPASIDYARKHNHHPSFCDFVLGDIRHVPFGGPHQLAMILYGEFNVFSPAEAQAILRKIAASLKPQAQLILETQTPPAVERIGHSDTSEHHFETGLFSDHPYCCRTESHWWAQQHATVQTFHITLKKNGLTQTYRSTTQGWSDDDLAHLLTSAGFTNVARRPEWPCNTSDLVLWSARKE